MVALSCASYYLVERPLRQADWGALRRGSTSGVGLRRGSGGHGDVILAGTVGPPSARRPRWRRRTGSPEPWPRALPVPPARGQAVTAWLFGDSVMVDSSPGITAALQATGTVRGARHGAPARGSVFRLVRGVRETWRSFVTDGHRDLVWDDQLAQSDPVGTAPS